MCQSCQGTWVPYCIISASLLFFFLIDSEKIITSTHSACRLVWSVFSCNNKVWQCLFLHQIFIVWLFENGPNQPSLLSAMSGRVGGAFSY